MNQQQSSAAATGTVVSLWRYPVKSMLGEELNSSLVTERGLLGDRTYAVIDKQTGKVASAKNLRKMGNLFDFRSTVFYCFSKFTSTVYWKTRRVPGYHGRTTARTIKDIKGKCNRLKEGHWIM